MRQNSEAKQLIKYFKSLGIEVYTNTKARGHQGFFLKNRIDISKNTKEERVVPTLLHEFAHYIHNKLEPDMPKTGGSLAVLFCLCEEQNDAAIQKNVNPSPCFQMFENLTLKTDLSPKGRGEKIISTFEKELLAVTNFVDENSLCAKLKGHKAQVKEKSKFYENIIKEYYPNFKRSEKFRDFDKYIKKSKAKYLLRFDRVKFISPFLRREEIFTIDNLEQDFPDMNRAFCAYIRLKSSQRKQARISRRINHLDKYYSKPAELFARLVEGLYIDESKTRELAPHATQRFFELLDSGYYYELKEVFHLLSGRRIETTNLSEKYLLAQS